MLYARSTEALVATASSSSTPGFSLSIMWLTAFNDDAGKKHSVLESKRWKEGGSVVL